MVEAGGCGTCLSVDGGRLKIVVVARSQLTPPEWAQWQRAIAKASELLFDATQGQLPSSTAVRASRHSPPPARRAQPVRSGES